MEIEKKKKVVPEKLFNDKQYITNKHYVVEFYYMILAYDNTESEKSKGYIEFPIDFFNSESSKDIGISSLNSDSNQYLSEIQKHLKDKWHKQLNKIEILFNNCKTIKNINKDYISEYIKEIDILTKNIDEIIKKEQIIVPIRISFHLTSSINSVSEYGVNPTYLHSLINGKIVEMSLELEELRIPTSLVPFCKEEPDDYHDDTEDPIYFISPKIKFIPLHFYKK